MSAVLDGDSLWFAIALVFVLEGLVPFVSPSGWRQVFARLLQMQDGQIRFLGLVSILTGLTLVWVLS